jgi:hypothetical protein
MHTSQEQDCQQQQGAILPLTSKHGLVFASCAALSQGPLCSGQDMRLHTAWAALLPPIFGRGILSSGTVVGIAYVLLLTSIWSAACGDLSGHRSAKQLCKGIHKTCISCLAQSGIKWRSVCGKQSPSARHGPWQRLGFKASSTLDFVLGCAIHAYTIPVVRSAPAT